MRLSYALLVALIGCSGSGTRSGFDTSAPSMSSSSGGGSSGGLGSSGSSGGATPPAGGAAVLYAHTDTTLFQADPNDLGKPLTMIGDFDCSAGKSGAPMTDLAVAKDGKLYGVSEQIRRRGHHDVRARRRAAGRELIAR